MANVAWTVSAVFNWIDKATAPLKKTADGLKGMAKAAASVAKPADAAANGVKKVASGASSATRPVESLGGAIRKMARMFDEARLAEMYAREGLEKYNAAGRRSQGVTEGLGHTLRWATAALAGFSLFKLAQDFVGINAKVEGFETALVTTIGSQSKARAAMQWIQNFAKQTPYNIEEVTQAFIQLQAYGFDPMKGSLQAVGDASSAMNRQLWQGVLAMSDAQVGMYRELKEFGITAEEAGDTVKFSWQKNGQQMQIVTKKTSANIQKAVIQMFNSIGGGGMERQSKTFNGMLSNMQDAWFNFNVAIGKAGAFDAIEANLQKIANWMSDPKNQKTIQTWAKQISDAIKKVWDGVSKLATSVDWVKLIQNFADLVSNTADFVQKAGGLGNILDGIIAAWIFLSVLSIAPAIEAAAVAFGAATATGATLIPAILGAASAFLGLDVAMGPITLIVAAVAALAAGAYLVWRHWDKVSAFFVKLWDEIKTAFDEGISALWNSFPDWLKSLLGWAGHGIASGFKAAANAWNAIDVSPIEGLRDGGLIPYNRSGNLKAGGQMSGSMHVTIDAQGRPSVASATSQNMSLSHDTNYSVGRGLLGAGQ